MKKMKMNKEKFLKTEFGSNMVQCVVAWDKALDERRKYNYWEEEFKKEEKVCAWCQAQWEVYQLAVKQFYGIEYHFSRMDEYVGIVTEDGSDWLLKQAKELQQYRAIGTVDEFQELMAVFGQQKGGAACGQCIEEEACLEQGWRGHFADRFGKVG